jgi:antitoxin (DNA-binding transcriptional repressor) of toxin-antitoxin stability system
MRRSSAVTRRFNVRDARANFSDLLGLVYYGQEPLRKGRPVAVPISPEQWEQYQRATRGRFFEAVDQLQERNRTADPADIEREVDRIVEEVRREHYEGRQRNTGRGA